MKMEDELKELKAELEKLEESEGVKVFEDVEKER